MSPQYTRCSRRPVVLLAGLVVAGLLVGCGAGSEPDDRSAPDATALPGPGPAEPAEQVAAFMADERAIGERLTDEGTIPVDLALDLFAGTFGAIDGGDPDAVGPAHISTSRVVRGVLAHWAELTDEQRVTVEAAVGPAADGGPEARDAAGAPGEQGIVLAVAVVDAMAPAAPTTATPLPDISAELAAVRADVESLVGRTLSVPVTWAERPLPAGLRGDDTASDALAGSSPSRGGHLVGDGRMDACHVEVYPAGVAARTATPAFFRSVLAHELAHCLQLDGVPDVVRLASVPDWILEGQADFVAATLVPDGHTGSAWTLWLTDPETSLFRRGYDALGAFATAQQNGADVWVAMIPMLTAPSSRAALELLFGTSPEEAMRAIAMALVREPGLGAAWESSGPGIVDARGTTEHSASDGAPATADVRLQRYGTSPHAVVVSGAVVDVVVDGALGALGTPGGRTDDVGPGFMARYCVTGSCTCPDGTDVGGAEIPGDGRFGLALTAVDPVVARFRLTVLSLEDACANKPGAATLVVRFTEPTEFEIHGGQCIVGATGDLIVQAGGDQLPEGYVVPPAHNPNASMTIYKNPTSPADHGSVLLTVDGVDAGGGSNVVIAPDLLSGTFSLRSGYVGQWRCAELLTEAELAG